MKKQRIIFATGNEGKMREIRMVLGDLDCEILSMKEAGIAVDIVEDGTTFEENAVIKAEAIAAVTDDIVLADDSGLEVDCMGGAPGVYSARFLGEDTSYEIKNRYIIDQCEGKVGEERSARFVAVIACAQKGHPTVTKRGVIEGLIADEPAGENGFGYDPIFYLPERGLTTAQLSLEEKNTISHRGRGLTAMKPVLEERLREEGKTNACACDQ